MDEFLSQYAIKTHFQGKFDLPDWIKNSIFIDDFPKARNLQDNIYSLSDGFFGLTCNETFDSTSLKLIKFPRPFVAVIFIANNLESILYHEHKIELNRKLSPLDPRNLPGFPIVDYNTLKGNYAFSERAKYRRDGAFVDKNIEIQEMTFSFLCNDIIESEIPYLIEIRRRWNPNKFNTPM